MRIREKIECSHGNTKFDFLFILILCGMKNYFLLFHLNINKGVHKTEKSKKSAESLPKFWFCFGFHFIKEKCW